MSGPRWPRDAAQSLLAQILRASARGQRRLGARAGADRARHPSGALDDRCRLRHRWLGQGFFRARCECGRDRWRLCGSQAASDPGGSFHCARPQSRARCRGLCRRYGDTQTGRFDLAISLEVAEHLEPQRSDSLVRDLCALADTVLFAAAIPFQGGAGHINERWQSWWAQKFSENGYDPFDVLRRDIWGRRDIAWWYKQNTIFYVKRNSPAHARFLRASRSRPARCSIWSTPSCSAARSPG